MGLSDADTQRDGIGDGFGILVVEPMDLEMVFDDGLLSLAWRWIMAWICWWDRDEWPKEWD